MAIKKRAHKTSKGEHGGGGKVKLTSLQKVLMGKGVAQSLSHKRDVEERQRRAAKRTEGKK